MSGALVLCYHAVSECWPATLAIAPRDLERHVALLADHGYRGVTFREAVAHPSNPRALAITFDDAYRSVIELALPILSTVGFVATVFAPTEFVGSDEPMAWPGIDHWLAGEHADELEPMSWQELAQLARAGWEIGSHTCSHRRLSTLDEQTLDEELQDSRRVIERELGTPCRSLAYPYGDYDRCVVEAAQRAGYEAAGTLPARFRRPSNPYEWPRMVVVREDGPRRFRLKISPLMRGLRATPPWSALEAVRSRTRARQAATDGTDI
jgi:peptidoglycan/xylan/chitin deacetylase (PgdA/CDA1 family)